MVVYVDDPLRVFRGTFAQARRNALTLVLWWAALGPDISWGKVTFGEKAHWIGAEISIRHQLELKVSLPQKYVEELDKTNEEILNSASVPLKVLQRHAGCNSWAAGIVPVIGSQLQCVWAAMADAINGRAEAAEAVEERAPKRAKCEPEPRVPVARMAHALRWLRAFYRKQRAGIERTFYLDRHRWPARIRVTTDASPWGCGAWLAVDGRPVEWLADAWTVEDCSVLRAVIGESKHQATWEACGILIACRSWVPVWAQERLVLVVDNDSKAALGAMGKERSKSEAVNLVARELALDLAELNYSVSIEYRHLRGKVNLWADSLSRLSQPDSSYKVPEELRWLPRRTLSRRVGAWWQTVQDPVGATMHEASHT